MAWNATVTNAGAALLSQWNAGGTLTITTPKGSTGRVAVTQLVNQTTLTGTTMPLSLIKSKTADVGVTFEVQIEAMTSAVNISQIGIFGKIGTGSETLIAIYQCDEGEEINVPDDRTMPDFAYVFAATVTMSVTGDLSVTLDSTALVSQGQLDETINTAAQAFLSEIDQLSGRISTLSTQLDSLGDPVTVAHGGTGLTASPSLLVNLDSTSAANVLQASPRPGVYGTLPIAQGGTGATTLNETRETLCVPYSAHITSSELSGIYTMLSHIGLWRHGIISLDMSSTGVLTNGKLSIAGRCVVWHGPAGNYSFFCMPSTGEILYTWRVSNFSSADATPTFGTIYRYNGTAV